MLVTIPYCEYYEVTDSFTSIKQSMAENNAVIKEIIIGDSIKTIGKYAFSGCHNLTNIILSKELTKISDGAFAECALQEIVFPPKIEYIGNYAFAGCSNLQEITIPDSVESIGDFAFRGCQRLECINLLSPLIKTINRGSFVCCYELETITIPSSVEYIARESFTGCYELKTIFIKGANIKIHSLFITKVGSSEFNIQEGNLIITHHNGINYTFKIVMSEEKDFVYVEDKKYCRTIYLVFTHKNPRFTILDDEFVFTTSNDQ